MLTFLDAEDAGSNEAAFPAARRRGFTYRADTREAYGWIGEGVGDAIEFELRGDAHRAATTVCFNYLKSYRHMGSVRASVDGGELRVLDALQDSASLAQAGGMHRRRARKGDPRAAPRDRRVRPRREQDQGDAGDLEGCG